MGNFQYIASYIPFMILSDQSLAWEPVILLYLRSFTFAIPPATRSLGDGLCS